jgi:1,4-alpha-glucan branching enzyme
MLTQTRKRESVTFAYRPNACARTVYLVGDFNDWQPQTHPMKTSGDGSWRATVKLAPGPYQYKFVVDGAWVNDPDAADQVPNPYGTLNSRIFV